MRRLRRRGGKDPVAGDFAHCRGSAHRESLAGWKAAFGGKVMVGSCPGSSRTPMAHLSCALPPTTGGCPMRVTHSPVLSTSHSGEALAAAALHACGRGTSPSNACDGGCCDTF